MLLVDQKSGKGVGRGQGSIHRAFGAVARVGTVLSPLSAVRDRGDLQGRRQLTELLFMLLQLFRRLHPLPGEGGRVCQSTSLPVVSRLGSATQGIRDLQLLLSRQS